MNTRNEAALCIQRLFRGWRTRQRVVRCVREELSAFMAAIEQDIEVERVLLGLPKPQTSRWLPIPDDEDSKNGEVKTTLHLPRMEDNVFGLRFSFPMPEPKIIECNTASQEEESTHDDHAVEDASRNELSGDEAEATVTNQTLVTSESTLLHDETEDENPEPSRVAPAAFAEPSAGDFDQEAHSAESIRSSPSGHSSISSHSDTGSVIMKDESKSSGITVEQILATHTKADIQMELQWARQALRDRLRYLNARQRTQP